MCELCNKIWKGEEEYHEHHSNHWDEEIAIIVDDDKFNLYVPCSDWFYSGIVMELNYCPICGKRLSD
jgi:hypothetical protein